MRSPIFRALLESAGLPAPAPSPAPSPGAPARGPAGFDPIPRSGGAASVDPIAARLPPRAAAKYRVLRAEHGDLVTAANALHEQREGLRRGRAIAAANLENAKRVRGQAETHSVTHLEA